MLTNVLIAVGTLLLGILATYHYSHRRSLAYVARQRKVLDPVGGEHPSEVEIIFDGVKVTSLDEWKIILWNSGNQTINDSEVAEKITFRFGDDKVLKATDPVTSRPAIHPAVHVTNSTAEVSFDYLDRSDYIAFSVYVVPPVTDDQGLFDVSGSVRGIPKGPTDKTDYQIHSRRNTFLNAALIVLSLVCIYGSSRIFLEVGQVLNLWHLFPEIAGRPPKQEWARWALLLGSPLVIVILTIGGGLIVLELWNSYIGVPSQVRREFAPRSRKSGAHQALGKCHAPLQAASRPLDEA